MRSRSAHWRFNRTYTLLTAAILVHAYLCWRWRIPLAWDATHAYLPAARRLLSEGPSFLLKEASVWYPFAAYAWPALLGADVPVIEIANLLMSSFIVLMVYRTCALAHSVRAGLIAAWLYAVSPAAEIVLNVLTEVPFLFFCALWLWAFSELRATDRRRWTWIAALALVIAVNFRASLLPFIYLSALVAIVASASRVSPHSTWKQLATIQAIAAALLTLVVAKNLVLFGLPQVASGVGNAFYLGSHPLVGGYEPAYAGMMYDTGAITREAILTLSADRYLRSVAWQVIADQPLWVMLTNYWRKASAFLFYPNVLLDDSLFTLRSLRILLVAGALVAIIGRWRVAAITLAASVTVYQVAAHAALLYNPRYAEGALDVCLPILAGCGFAIVSGWSLRNVSLFAATVLVACFIGKSIRHLEDRVAPLHFNPGVPHQIVWQQTGIGGVELDGLARADASDALRATAAHTSLRFPMPTLSDIFGVRGTPRQHHLFIILEASTPPSGARCDKGRIVFRTKAPDPARLPLYSYYPFRLSRDAEAQTFAFGVSEPTPTWVAPIDGPGDLAIEFSCDVGATIRFVRFALAESTYAKAYGRKEEPPREPNRE